MDQVISEHLSSIENYRSFCFDVDPLFIKIEEKILFFDKIVYYRMVEDGIFTESIIQNSKPEGVKIATYKTRYILKCRHRHGKKEGLSIVWHMNGQKQSEVNYQNGLMEGVYTSWHNDGHKYAQGNYHNGEENGLWTYLYNCGQIREEQNYRVVGPEGRNGELID